MLFWEFFIHLMLLSKLTMLSNIRARRVTFLVFLLSSGARHCFRIQANKEHNSDDCSFLNHNGSNYDSASSLIHHLSVHCLTKSLLETLQEKVSSVLQSASKSERPPAEKNLSPPSRNVEPIVSPRTAEAEHVKQIMKTFADRVTRLGILVRGISMQDWTLRKLEEGDRESVRPVVVSALEGDPKIKRKRRILKNYTNGGPFDSFNKDGVIAGVFQSHGLIENLIGMIGIRRVDPDNFTGTSDTAKVGMLYVRKEFQKFGLSYPFKKVLGAALDAWQDVQTVVLTATIEAEGLYTRWGFKALEHTRQDKEHGDYDEEFLNVEMICKADDLRSTTGFPPHMPVVSRSQETGVTHGLRPTNRTSGAAAQIIQTPRQGAPTHKRKQAVQSVASKRKDPLPSPRGSS